MMMTNTYSDQILKKNLNDQMKNNILLKIEKITGENAIQIVNNQFTREVIEEVEKFFIETTMFSWEKEVIKFIFMIKQAKLFVVLF